VELCINHYQAILQALPDSVYVMDSEGVILFAQAHSDADLFADKSKLIGQSIQKVLPTNLSDQFLYYLNRACEKKQLEVCEFNLNSKSGLNAYEARFFASGSNEVLVFVRNIAARKTAEKNLVEMLVQLEESHDNLLSILNQQRLGTAMVESDGALTFMSDVALKLLNVEGMYRGKHWQQVFPLQDSEIQQIKNLSNIPSKKRVKVPVKIAATHTWVEVEVQDHPQDPKRKIFVFYDVSEVYALKQQLDEKNQFEGMVGQSEPMRHVFGQVKELSRLEVTVLIEGETGTGKELVARALHKLSPRQSGPFIPVNCAGLTNSSILSSQLFGHKRGSFTGAVQDQEGLIEAADGGTLFLDELGDIPPDVQTSLLRFLQEKEITRLGESKTRKVDVRIVAATQYDLLDQVQLGKFRQDLYYRIHVAALNLPPLRDRLEDVPLLAAVFLDQSRKTVGKTVKRIDPAAMQLLMKHDWPGNVRELSGVIESAVIQSSSDTIEVADLPPGLQVVNHPVKSQDERQQIIFTLDKTHGNRAAAARILGMSRATFYRRLESYDIQ
jgi:sigma-54 dependent transcriptional regulator, acetoin dehydrogenase operon transcriptional activator AcoR